MVFLIVSSLLRKFPAFGRNGAVITALANSNIVYSQPPLCPQASSFSLKIPFSITRQSMQAVTKLYMFISETREIQIALPEFPSFPQAEFLQDHGRNCSGVIKHSGRGGRPNADTGRTWFINANPVEQAQ
jgi:hypothetical protein